MTTLTLDRPTPAHRPAPIVRTTACATASPRPTSTPSAASSTPSASGCIADLGEEDVTYLRRVIRWQRGLAAAGRASLFLGFLPPFWIGGAAALGISKILDNMEIGHNVMHGQYDWTRDPALASGTFEWDAACPADQWRHSHNYLHHTFTNIHGKDRDIGYGILRISPDQPWNPIYLGNPLFATAPGPQLRPRRDAPRRRDRPDHGRQEDLDAGVAHPARRAAEVGQARPQGLRPVAGADRAAVPVDAARQPRRQHDPQRVGLHDHLLRPLPRPACTSSPRPSARTSPAATGTSARCSAPPTSPAAACSTCCPATSATRSSTTSSRTCRPAATRRSPPEVRAACERFGLPYNSHRLSRQFGTVVGKILRHALPSRPVTPTAVVRPAV